MLPKSQRLNLKKDFKWVASGSPRSAGGAGRKLEIKYLKLFVKEGGNQMPRIGIAVSGKSFRKATQRNRAKRLVSAAFEVLYERLLKNANIVALPKAGIVGVKSQDVLSDLKEALENAKVID